ncbi:hypothetical protein QTP88_003709 [Uroleucon formosanum]
MSRESHILNGSPGISCMCILGGRMSSVVRNTIVTQQPESDSSPTLRSVYDDGEAGSLYTEDAEGVQKNGRCWVRRFIFLTTKPHFNAVSAFTTNTVRSNFRELPNLYRTSCLEDPCDSMAQQKPLARI